jgi:hypothetical protein
LIFNFFESKSFIDIPLNLDYLISSDEYFENGILSIDYLYLFKVTDLLLIFYKLAPLLSEVALNLISVF